VGIGRHEAGVLPVSQGPDRREIADTKPARILSFAAMSRTHWISSNQVEGFCRGLVGLAGHKTPWGRALPERWMWQLMIGMLGAAPMCGMVAAAVVARKVRRFTVATFIAWLTGIEFDSGGAMHDAGQDIQCKSTEER